MYAAHTKYARLHYNCGVLLNWFKKAAAEFAEEKGDESNKSVSQNVGESIKILWGVIVQPLAVDNDKTESDKNVACHECDADEMRRVVRHDDRGGEDG